MDRIAEAFQRVRREGRTGLVVFLTAGYPDLDATFELVPALAEAGADVIELGVPFSDPMADGVTIQESSQRALEKGVSLRQCLDLVGRLRDRVPDTGLLLMGYYNPVFPVWGGQVCFRCPAGGTRRSDHGRFARRGVRSPASGAFSPRNRPRAPVRSHQHR